VAKLNRVHYYFKLDPNVRNETEVKFGRMEIQGLIGREVEAIGHFYDVMKKPPLSYFDNGTIRIQDFLLNPRTAYGAIQGYYFSDELLNLAQFIERLAYTREIYVCLQTEEDTKKIQQVIFPFGVEGKNFQVWNSSDGKNRYCLFRIITNIFFLEQINNVILCSEGSTPEKQIDRMNKNMVLLTDHIMQKMISFVPKFPKDSNWKEFQDFVDEPKEITLYLTQFYGPPYKAKFHPRMIRALLNFANVKRGDVTGDFMLGSGTLAIESVLLGLNSKGSDINPLTEIVANSKIDALKFEPKELRMEIDTMVADFSKTVEFNKTNTAPYVLNFFKNKKDILDKASFLTTYINTKVDKKYRNFFLCALASVVSSAYKMRNEADVFRMMGAKLWKMWKVVYCLNKVQDFLHIQIGEAGVRTDDITKPAHMEKESVDLIITSPPYSTAIDYVKMDLPQLLLLDLVKHPRELDENMMGTHRKTADLNELSQHIVSSRPLVLDQNNRFPKLPPNAQRYILDLKEDGNMNNALRCYRFLYNMWDALSNMQKALKPNGRCIIIIGNNVFTVKGRKEEFRNGDFLGEMALRKEIGFQGWREKIVREYSKSSYGTIIKEDIIFLKKTAEQE
jgi:DNA modification methylase